MKYSTVVTIILVISLFANLYFLFSRSSTARLTTEKSSTDSSSVVALVPPFRHGYPSAFAKEHVENYRKLTMSPKDTETQVILYDSSDIVDYMKTTYKSLTASLRPNIPDTCVNCKIMVGFYLMKISKKGKDEDKDKVKDKYSFFVIPTIVNARGNDTSKWKIYDFVDSIKYYSIPQKNIPPQIAYDAGQMYP